LQVLTRDHYPELAIRFADADLLGLEDLGGLVMQGVTLKMYDPPSKVITKGRNEVRVTALGGAPCVLKQFKLASDSDRKKFRTEARQLRALEHPHVVRLEAVVYLQTETVLEAYIHMVYHPGEDMAVWLERHGPSPERKQVVLHQACQGLEYLHAQNVLHCDIKLDNILMDADSAEARPLIADFDISKDTEQRTQTLTVDGVQGTPMYMAPEILPVTMVGGKGERQTEFSDMYAFGIVCMLSFSASRRREGAVEPAQSMELDANTPSAVKTLLRKLLAQRPSDRGSASEALADPALRVEAIVKLLEVQRAAAEQPAEDRKEELEADRVRVQEQAAEAAERARALLRDCCICGDDTAPVHQGVECGAPDGAEQHFVCNDCFVGHVSN
jgi:serine/threonine protein kinase